MNNAQLLKSFDVPLYSQLAQLLKHQVDHGELKAGDQLLTESELSQKYGVSRITVRKAVELLVDEEILVKRQGIGTFVLPPKLSRHLHHGVEGFTDNCVSMGKTPSAKLLDAALTTPTEADIAQLNLQPGEKIIRIYRIRYCDGIPVMLEDSHFPQKYAFLLSKDLESSLLGLLKESGIYLATGTKSIGICHASKQESEYLDVPLNSALLLIKDVNYEADQVPVYTTKCIINPDRYRLTVQV